MLHSMINLFVIAALLMLPCMAQAQMAPPRGTDEDQKACDSDARRHCRAVLDQGDVAVLACLQQNRTKLTRRCQAVLTRHGQ
jgi:Cysteine rich repeat